MSAPTATKWPASYTAKDRVLVWEVSLALSAVLKLVKVTQAKFAKSIGENRTTISHIINCTNPATQNPVFKSLAIVKRVEAKLKKYPAPVGPPRPTKKVTTGRTRSQMPNNAVRKVLLDNMRESIQDYIKHEVREAIRERMKGWGRAAIKHEVREALRVALPAAAASAPLPPPVGRLKPRPNPKTVKRGQIWQSRDKRRVSQLVEVVAVHHSMDAKHASVRVKNLKGEKPGHHRQSQYDGFVKRFEYVAASRGRVKP